MIEIAVGDKSVERFGSTNIFYSSDQWTVWTGIRLVLNLENHRAGIRLVVLGELARSRPKSDEQCEKLFGLAAGLIEPNEFSVILTKVALANLAIGFDRGRSEIRDKFVELLDLG